MWTRWWDGSPRFVLVRIHERDGETEKEKSESLLLFTFKTTQDFYWQRDSQLRR